MPGQEHSRNEMSARQNEKNDQAAYTFISFFSFVMHTFGAITRRCKLAQHKRASQKQQYAQARSRSQCVSAVTQKTNTKPMLVLISSHSNFLWRFTSLCSVA